MGSKISWEWTIESVSPEGKVEVMASSGHVEVARAAFKEALRHRPGRVVRFKHGALILRQETGAAAGSTTAPEPY